MRKVAVIYDFENTIDKMLEANSNLEMSMTIPWGTEKMLGLYCKSYKKKEASLKCSSNYSCLFLLQRNETHKILKK